MIKTFIVVLLLTLGCYCFGFNQVSTQILQQDKNCYMWYINAQNSGFLLMGDGNSFPTCPTSYKATNVLEVKGMFCSVNSQQSQTISNTNGVNGYSWITSPVIYPPTFINNSFNNSQGNNKVLLSMKNIDPNNLQLWCATNQDSTQFQLAEITDICYGFPVGKLSYCSYSNKVCTIDGICFLDQLSFEYHLYSIKPFFNNVIPESQLYMTFVNI